MTSGTGKSSRVKSCRAGLLVLLAATTLVICSTGCRFAGTPKEEILRHGGTIEQLPDGGSSVNLTGPKITDIHLHAVAALTANHPEYGPLRRLDLSGSSVTDAGLKTLGSLNSLEMVDLNNTHVTDAGLEAFRLRAPNCRILKDESQE